MSRFKIWRQVCVVAGALCMWGAAVGLAQESVPVAMKVDHRGLIEIPGVLRANSGHHWGAANLIVFGPSWGYSAQDYALKNVQKTGGGNDITLNADLSVPGAKIKIEQTTKSIKTASGKSGLRVTWTLRSAEAGKPMGLQLAYIAFPFGVAETAGLELEADTGDKLAFPVAFGNEYLPFPRHARSAILRAPKTTFGLEGQNLNVVVVDGRKQKNENFQVRLEFPNVKDGGRSTVEFDVWAEFPPFTIQAGKDWVPFPYTNEIAPGSILDFSFLNEGDAPAGKYGRIVVGPDGHYAFEKRPDRRVRLVGANLCYSANFVDQATADKLALHFKRMGYNTVRFHHTDVTMMKGGWDAWNAIQPSEIDPSQLDRIDYLFAAMKKAGLYVTIDLYAMGSYGKTIAGIAKGVRGELKALVPIHEPAFKAWGEFVMLWLDHVNPYTGLAWKDDPALVNICPLNEDSIASVWWDAKDLYNAKFAEWKKGRQDSGRTEAQLLAQFLTEVKVESNREIEKFLRARGVKALLSGCNWWDTMAQTFERDTLDVVDNHQYADHPVPHWLPSRYNQKTTIREGNPTYMVPIMKAPTRIFGKPFIITEWNFCMPNRHRAEGGAMVGAYAALQDWDALYRFAWAHDEKFVKEQLPATGFDISTDPLNQLAERLVLLMFRRVDVSPARKRFVYGVTMAEATEQGVGDMWSKGIFPHGFNAMALMSQIGSQVIEGDRVIQGTFDGVVAAAEPPAEKLSGNPYLAKRELTGIKGMQEIVSDTGEIAIDNKKGHLRVTTPKTACIVAPAGAALAAGGLSVANADVFSSVSASAMDDRALAESRRVLVLHLTNVLNTDMAFSDDKMTMLYRTGKLPYLARTGSVDVKLRNANPDLKLYAIGSDGRRLRQVPATWADGAYTFKAAIAPGDAPPTMIYELAE
ncbi:MAG: hypothetical protein ACOX9C_00450 [Kiritimatiellia bacterium]|jgi:hypothetical protein